MASVWAARHELLAREVAIKITPAADKSVEQTTRFLREASIVGRLSHENVVSVLDAGQTGDPKDGIGEAYLFLVMELLRGAPLADRFVPGQTLEPEEIVPVLVDVCRGLEAAHAAGVVHRDVKPENVFLAETTVGTVAKLVDFGISHVDEGARPSITLDGQVLGTPAYMSPEQALGTRAVDGRADLWAVGVILYEALAGRQPFGSSSHHAVLRRIVDEEPEPLPRAVDVELRAIVRRCLEKKPEHRYADATALRSALEGWLERRGVSLRPAGRAWHAVPLAAGGESGWSSVMSTLRVDDDSLADRPTEIDRPIAAPPRSALDGLRTMARHPRSRAAMLGVSAIALLCLGASARLAPHAGDPALAHEEARALPVAAAAAPSLAFGSSGLAGDIAPEAVTTASDISSQAATPRQVAPMAVATAPARASSARPLTRVTSPGF
jgi:serine/threonine-protein kinase